MKQILSIFAMLLLFTSNSIANHNEDIGQVRRLAPFKGVEASQGAQIAITIGDEQLVTVLSDDEDVLHSVITEVRGGILKVSIDDRYKKNKFRDTPIKVSVVMPKLTTLTANTNSHITVLSVFDSDENLAMTATTAGQIVMNEAISGAKLSVTVNSNGKLISHGMFKVTGADVTATSAGEATLNAEVDGDVKCSAAGKAKILMNGKANNVQLSAMSNAEIRMKGFSTKNANAVGTSTALIQITVEDSLAATAANNAVINYWGKPKSVSKETTTGGKVK